MNAYEALHEDLRLEERSALLVDSLSPTEAGRLLRLLDEARAAQADDVGTGIDAMVAAIPPGVRGRVRKVLQRDEPLGRQ